MQYDHADARAAGRRSAGHLIRRGAAEQQRDPTTPLPMELPAFHTDSTGTLDVTRDDPGLLLTGTKTYTLLRAPTISYRYFPNRSRQMMTA